MATDAQSLLATVGAYASYGSNTYMLRLMELALLRQIALAANPMADTSPQALLAAASCFQCFGANSYNLQLMELALLKAIADAGGTGGGAGDVFSGNGSPVGVVAPTGTSAIYIQLDSVPPRQLWTFASGSWS